MWKEKEEGMRRREMVGSTMIQCGIFYRQVMAVMAVRIVGTNDNLELELPGIE